MAEADNAFTASMAEVYDRRLGPVLFEPYARDLARRIAHSPPDRPQTACGTGILTRQLRLHLHPSVRIVATDVNQGMIDYARFGLHTLQHIHWHLADAAALPFPSGNFAAVACQFGMMFVRDKEAAFREARRVLADDGVLVFSVWDSLAHNPCSRIAHETVTVFCRESAEYIPGGIGISRRRRLRRTLLAHGLDNLRVDTATLEVHSSSAGLLALGQIEGGPVSYTIRQHGIAVDRVVDAVAEALARLGGDRPFRSTMQAIVVMARKAAAGTRQPGLAEHAVMNPVLASTTPRDSRPHVCISQRRRREPISVRLPPAVSRPPAGDCFWDIFVSLSDVPVGR